MQGQTKCVKLRLYLKPKTVNIVVCGLMSNEHENVCVGVVRIIKRHRLYGRGEVRIFWEGRCDV